MPSTNNAIRDIPRTTQILVIGGGPAGSYAAASLAREGLDVVLLDMSKFPRYHIGESLLPSARHYLRFIGAEDKVVSHGFARKPGSAIKFNQYMREGYTDFVAIGANNNAWNVVRSEFDELLLKHAASCGVKVFTETKVDSLEFAPSSGTSDADRRSHGNASVDTEAPATESGGARDRSGSVGGLSVEFEAMGRPVKASYTTLNGIQGEINFEYLIDASGRAGLLSTKYLKNRRYNQSLKNVAVWGYWRGTGMYGKGTTRENAPFFEALSDESGWAWFIPLHNGRTSVGIVMNQKALGIRSRAASSATSAPLPANGSSAQTQSTLADRYLTFLHLAPGVQALIGDNAELVSVQDENGNAPKARSASDFSYSAEKYAGAGWRIVGDAGAFIDPFFSSGIHLAMTGALSAAASVCASMKGDCDEAEAAAWYSKRLSISYTRFLVVVLSAYKQIRAQSTNVLADIDDDNFDKAFAFFRPVIQGGADMGKRLSEDEVQRALDFCVNLFSPTTPEQHESVRRRLQETPWWCASELDGRDNNSEMGTSSVELQQTPERLLDVCAPVVDPGVLTRLLKTRLSFLWRRSEPSPPPSVLSLDAKASLPSSPRSPSPSPSSPVSSLFSARSTQTESDVEAGGDENLGKDAGKALEGDEEIRMVLDKVNARRVIHAEFNGEGNSLEQEAVGGLLVRLVRGELGLVRVPQNED